MDDAQIGLLAVVASALIFLVVLIFGPVLAPNLPQEALIRLSIFNLPSSVASTYNISPDSVAAYAVWGFIASVVALGVDFAMFLGLKAR
jgi:hypothetical protein